MFSCAAVWGHAILVDDPPVWVESLVPTRFGTERTRTSPSRRAPCRRSRWATRMARDVIRTHRMHGQYYPMHATCACGDCACVPGACESRVIHSPGSRMMRARTTRAEVDG